MSHLLKNKKKKYFFLFKLIIIFFILYLFIQGTKSYTGNIFIYFIFSIVSSYLIIFGFRKNAIFFDTFFSIFLWLGFWFKFTCTIAFTDGLFREGGGSFDYKPKSFDDALLISTYGIFAFLVAGFIREKLMFNYPNKIKIDNNDKIFNSKYRKLIWIIFLTFTLSIGFLNFYFKIYQKGLLPIYDLNFLFSGIIKWLLLFGLASISSVLIFFEAKRLKKFFVFSSFVVFFETFISSFSMLSRGMIFNAFALLFGIYKFSNKINLKNNISYYLKFLLLIAILFYISVAFVNYLRANYFYVGKSLIFSSKENKKLDTVIIEPDNAKKYSSLKEHNSELVYLVINRWVGIDGVLAVSSKNEILNLDFLRNSLKERADPKQPTFYELTFNLKNKNLYDKNSTNIKGNTLPGIIAFCYYSGSILFLIISIISISLLSSLIEYIAFLSSKQNLIFSGLIGQVIAFRFIHFGYLPHQSYLLFSSIFLTILFVYLLNVFIKKYRNQ